MQNTDQNIALHQYVNDKDMAVILPLGTVWASYEQTWNSSRRGVQSFVDLVKHPLLLIYQYSST